MEEIKRMNEIIADLKVSIALLSADLDKLNETVALEVCRYEQEDTVMPI